jgi:hypothetical protein
MEIRQEHIGKKYHSQLLGTQIEVCEENRNILLADRKYEFFTVDIESKPLKAIKTEIENSTTVPVISFKEKIISEQTDKRMIFDQLCVAALKDFAGQDIKLMKQQCKLVGIEFPRNCNLYTLADVVKSLPNDFVVK